MIKSQWGLTLVDVWGLCCNIWYIQPMYACADQCLDLIWKWIKCYFYLFITLAFCSLRVVDRRQKTIKVWNNMRLRVGWTWVGWHLSIPYLQHDHTDLLHTLDNGLWSTWDSDCPLSRIGQHVSSHLHLSPCRLENKHSTFSQHRNPWNKALPYFLFNSSKNV